MGKKNWPHKNLNAEKFQCKKMQKKKRKESTSKNKNL